MKNKIMVAAGAALFCIGARAMYWFLPVGLWLLIIGGLFLISGVINHIMEESK